MLTRRRFLLTLPAAAALPRIALDQAEAQPFVNPLRKKPLPPPAPSFVYIGTDSDKGGKGICLARFDAVTGHLTNPSLVAETARPSFLAVSAPIAGHRRVYAVNAVPNPSATVTSFLMDPATGALKQLNQVSSAGSGPCFVALDDTGKTAFVANYYGSSMTTYQVHPDGTLSDPVERIDFKDKKFSPAGAATDVPHPHCIILSPDNRFILVNDLGSDQTSVFTFDPATARLGTPVLFTNDRPGSGPRHLAFHPNRRWVYSINELDSTIDHFLWTTTSSRTSPQGLLINSGNHVKTTAPGSPKNAAAELAISADGNFLYASNRGEDTLVVFSISDTGALTFVQRIASGGKTPRHFTLDPSGHWLLCGNQDSGSITIFRRDGGTGHLTGPTATIPLEGPLFTLFV